MCILYSPARTCSGAGNPNIYNLWPLLMNAKCKKKGYAAVFSHAYWLFGWDGCYWTKRIIYQFNACISILNDIKDIAFQSKARHLQPSNNWYVYKYINLDLYRWCYGSFNIALSPNDSLHVCFLDQNTKRETISESWLPYLDTLLLLFSFNMSLICRCEELAGPCWHISQEGVQSTSKPDSGITGMATC